MVEYLDTRIWLHIKAKLSKAKLSKANVILEKVAINDTLHVILLSRSEQKLTFVIIKISERDCIWTRKRKSG